MFGSRRIFVKRGLIGNIYTRYHTYVCEMKLVCAYHTAVYPCACRSPIYCCLSGTTCILVVDQNISTSLLLLCTWYLVYSIIAVCVSWFCVVDRYLSRTRILPLRTNISLRPILAHRNYFFRVFEKFEKNVFEYLCS